MKASTLNSSRSNRITKLKEAPEAVRSFPNPSQGKFKILMEMNSLDNLDIKVFDLSGKLDHKIDLSNLEKGVYQLHL